MTETSVEQYYVQGLIDVPDHVRTQFECLTSSNSGNMSVEPSAANHATAEKTTKDNIIEEKHITQSCCQLSQGFLIQPLPSPMSEYKSLTRMEAKMQSSVDLSGYEELQQHFSLMVNSRLLSDVTLVAKDNCHIFAHRVFLSSRSPVFAEMFSSSDEAESNGCCDTQTQTCHRCDVFLDNVHSDAIMAMLRYIYTGSCDLQPEFIEELLWLADRFQLTGLQKLCARNSCIMASSTCNEIEEATLPATGIQTSEYQQGVQSFKNHHLRGSLPFNEYHQDNCSQALAKEPTDLQTVEKHFAQDKPHNNGHQSPQSPQTQHSPRIECSDPIPLSDASPEYELNNCMLYTPSPCLSVQSTEDSLIEQRVDVPTPASSPELPSLHEIISQPCCSSRTHREPNARYKESTMIPAQEENILSISNFSAAELNVRTPPFIPETPVVTNKTVLAKALHSETPVVGNSPREHDSDSDYLPYEEAIYDDWVSGDCMSGDTHQSSQNEISKSGNCHKQPFLVMSSDDSNSVQTVNPSDRGSGHYGDVKGSERFTGVTMDAQPCSIQTVDTDGSNGPCAINPRNALEVAMSDEDDELFACYIPDDEIIVATTTDITASQHCAVAKHQHDCPPLPQAKKAKKCVTPMPDYDNMATPVLKRTMNKFGMRNMAKRRMITKLKQVYHYTHPGAPAKMS